MTITIHLTPWRCIEDICESLNFAYEVNDFDLINQRLEDLQSICEKYNYDYNEVYNYFFASVTLSD